MNRLKGYQLLQDGSLALAQVEANGIRIDLERLERTRVKLKDKIRDLRIELEESSTWNLWRRRYGKKANISSRDQLGEILFGVLKLKPNGFTPTGKFSTDDEALQDIEDPFVKKLLRRSKFEKALNTFLKGIKDETCGDRLHPMFDLHTARSWRSSSSAPNFQNFPVRDKVISKIIRSCFIATDGCVLVENDFRGIEVSVSATYHKDPVFISYITTPGKDMHKDMAAQLYMLDPKDVSKDCRYGAKNKFVFPQFYGDYYVNCAKALWDWITRGKLTRLDGVSLMEHLKEQGIEELGECDPEQSPVPGTFEFHVKEVEYDFWNNRFQQYGKWRKDTYQKYLERGYFDLHTGFRVYGHYSRNAVTSYPVQGGAFHCLLWTLIQVQRYLTKYKMKAKIVGQIHDSLLGDVPIKELRDYLEIVERVATVELRKHFKWLNVPLEIEYEICPPGKSWFDKKEFKFKEGRFVHPESGKTTSDVDKFLSIL